MFIIEIPRPTVAQFISFVGVHSYLLLRPLLLANIGSDETIFRLALLLYAENWTLVF